MKTPFSGGHTKRKVSSVLLCSDLPGAQGLKSGSCLLVSDGHPASQLLATSALSATSFLFTKCLQNSLKNSSASFTQTSGRVKLIPTDRSATNCTALTHQCVFFFSLFGIWAHLVHFRVSGLDDAGSYSMNLWFYDSLFHCFLNYFLHLCFQNGLIFYQDLNSFPIL